MTLVYRTLPVSLNSDHPDRLPGMVARRLRLKPGSVRDLRILKKSLDSRRSRTPRWVYSVAFDLDPRLERKLLSRDDPIVAEHREADRVSVPTLVRPVDPRPVIVGAGPAGLFSAHRLAQAGVHPVVIERGPDVTERSKRWGRFLKGGPFDPESNLLFGEGGAGAYSDGKLYTRVHDPRSREVLELLARHGAPPEILYDAKPHIGSNLLPSIIRRLRTDLIERGVEFRFSTRMVGLALASSASSRAVTGIDLHPGGTLAADTVFLATGHSARDVYRMLAQLGIAIEPKPFQMGVRVEHPQPLIDRIQYGGAAGHPNLPPAEYHLVAKRTEGDVFSFCMCPGGEILPATEREGLICVNGASRYKRLSPFANSGFVVTVSPELFPDPADPLSGVTLQEDVERACAAAARAPFAVPALRLPDFLEAGPVSESLPETSYPFPVTAHSFEELFPQAILAAVREGLRKLGARIPSFVTRDAIVVAPESRSSSPLRLPRDPDTFESTSTPGLYPIGEGCGFAGGIVSAAIDGMRAAEAWCTARKRGGRA